jgi:catechol 2,3-dioxygenase-like lactoylglutathione lyase family enzyme
MSADELAYVALLSKDVDRVAHLFERRLGLARTDVPVANTSRTVPVFAIGRSAVALFAPGDPFLGGEEKAGVHHLAFSALDPERGGALAQSAGVPLLPGDAGQGLQNRKRVALDPAATAGVRAYLTEPIELRPSPSGTVQRIDHIGIASADNRAAIDIFCGKLGFVLESQQTDMEVEIAVESFTSDKYGAVYHTRPPRPAGGLRVAFITAGDCELEFLQNFDAAQRSFIDHASAGTTRQDQGAITRYIANRGAGLHHVALKVHDINAVLADLDRDAFITIDRVGRPGSRRALIGFVQPKSLGGILIHFVQRE